MPPVSRRQCRIRCAFLLSALSALGGPPARAAADCETGIEAALRRAAPLPATKGKAALMEQIQRAQIAHHEDDEDGCRDELAIATGVLDRIDAARRAGAGRSHPVTAVRAPSAG